MITVAHFLDDAALGGVTRFLDALTQRLGSNIRHTRHIVDPRAALPTQLDADVIVLHFTMSWAKLPYLLALRARTPRRPIVLVEHGYSGAFEALHVTATRRFRTMLRTAYAVADRVVAVSYGQARWMRAAHLLDASKLAVIRPFTDSAALAELPFPTSHDGPLRLAAFGRFSAQKAFDTAIAAMRTVDPSVATLVVRGFGPEADKLRSEAAPLPHVTIGDAIDDLAAFITTTDAIVVPSAFEPFGQVALEARLAARPLIVTDVDGLPEQVDPAFGIVVPPADPVALARAIEELAVVQKQDGWDRMCRASRASSAGHASTCVGRWLALLDELSERTPRRKLQGERNVHSVAS